MEFRALRGATAELVGSAKPFKKGLAENYMGFATKVLAKLQFI
jgi:hypothetical protein